MDEWILRVVIMPLIFGNFIYTWVANNSTRREVRDLKGNHLRALEKRVKDIEDSH